MALRLSNASAARYHLNHCTSERAELGFYEHLASRLSTGPFLPCTFSHSLPLLTEQGWEQSGTVHLSWPYPLLSALLLEMPLARLLHLQQRSRQPLLQHMLTPLTTSRLGLRADTHEGEGQQHVPRQVCDQSDLCLPKQAWPRLLCEDDICSQTPCNAGCPRTGHKRRQLAGAWIVPVVDRACEDCGSSKAPEGAP